MATPEQYLLKGVMPEINQMKKDELKQEAQFWRNVWSWVPHEVKYYVARTGQTLGLTQRNYRRMMGVLLDTHWDLIEIELGVADKVYSPTDGKYYFEKKVVRTKLGGLIDIQWIKDRISEEELAARAEAEEKEKEEEEE